MRQSILIILNDPPYGTERCYNGLRLAQSLVSKGIDTKIFLMDDSVLCAKKGQKVPTGFYNLSEILNRLAKISTIIGACGTCLDARGIKEQELIDGVFKSTLS